MQRLASSSLAVAVALYGGPAAAAAPSGVTLAPAEVGDAPVDAQAVDEEVSKALSTAVELTPSNGGETCAAGPCAASIAEATGVGHVVTASVQKNGPDHRVVMTLWKGSESVAEVEDTCEICGAAELLEVVGAAARAIGKKADQLTRPGTLALSVSPPGASVQIDGEAVDVDGPLMLLPGSHAITVSLEGYEEQTVDARIVAGVEEQLEITLDVVEPDEPPPAITEPERDRGVGLRGAGYAGLGLGLAALGTGVTLMVLEEQPITSDCSGENVDADGDCKYRYATLESGIAFAVGGGVVLASAIAMIVVGHRRKKASNVRVSASPTGLFVTGRF